MESVSDRELVKRFQRGDVRAFESLVHRHQDRIYRLARTRLYVPHEATDAAQEVFLRAYKGLRGFLFTAEPFTWLYRTMLNVCNEYNRRQTRSARLQNELAAEEMEEPFSEASNEESDLKKIRRLVTRLPARQQEVVMLRIFEDLSVDETARTMRCRPGTVKALLHKALNNLRDDALNA